MFSVSKNSGLRNKSVASNSRADDAGQPFAFGEAANRSGPHSILSFGGRKGLLIRIGHIFSREQPHDECWPLFEFLELALFQPPQGEPVHAGFLRQLIQREFSITPIRGNQFTEFHLRHYTREMES